MAFPGMLLLYSTGDSFGTFEDNYSFITKWGSEGPGNGQFQDAHALIFDTTDKLYVVDTNNSRIQVFDSAGNYITKWGSNGIANGEFKHPHGIAIDSFGNIYVTDARSHGIEFNSRIQKFDSNGNFITKWGSDGAGDGQFNDQHGISTDSSGNVYVADTNNNRIQKFDSNGNFITKWGSEGSEDGEFKHPHGIAVDSSGKVFINDRDNFRIQVFGKTGS
jgi:tripartite motif-containing protein 71